MICLLNDKDVDVDYGNDDAGHNELGQTSLCYCLLTPWLLDRRASNAISTWGPSAGNIYIYINDKDKYMTRGPMCTF